MPEDREEGRPSWANVLAANRFVVIALLVCTLVGIVVGLIFLSEDWSTARRLAGGAIGGAGVGFLLTATRMLGA